MRLYFLRHATAVPHGAPAYEDSDRPLTAEGRLEAVEVAAGLRRAKVNPNLVLTSPWRRALETAELVAKDIKSRPAVKTIPELTGDSDPRATLSALKPYATYAQLLLVGHEPHLSATLTYLIAAHGQAAILLKKAGAACVEIDRVPPGAGGGILRWLMTPKQLTLLGRDGHGS